MIIYLADTASASNSWAMLVQRSDNLPNSPLPALPKSATASFTNGPRNIVNGNKNARNMSDAKETVPGMTTDAEDSVSRWCERMR